MTKKIKNFFKVISIILTFAIILQSIPIAVSAQSQTDVSTETETQTETAVAYVISEDISKREESVKHFRMSDGSYTAVTYAQPIHYLDENNEYKDIDNTLILSEDGISYTNTSNPFKVTLPENSDGEVYVEYNGNEISFKLLDAKKAKKEIKEKEKAEEKLQKELSKAKTKKEKAEIINNDKYSLKNYDSSVTYSEVSDDVDITYDIVGTKLKESIVLYKKNAKNSYKYEFTFTDLTAVLNDDKSISFLDGETEVLKINAPYMFDSNGAASTDIEVIIEATETGCIYELIPSKDWLKDKERVYPVTIDPTIMPQLGARDIKDATVVYGEYNEETELWVSDSVETDDGPPTPYYYLKVGSHFIFDTNDELATAIYTPIPSEIPKTARIISARVGLAMDRVYSSDNAYEIRLDVFKITSDWGTGSILVDEILFTDTNPSVPSIDTTPIDFNFIECDVQQYYYFDITRAAQSWLQNEDNYGVMLKMESAYCQGNNVIYFRSSDFNGIDAEHKGTVLLC